MNGQAILEIRSEQAYVKILAYVKLLKMVYASVVKFNVSKYVIQLWSTNTGTGFLTAPVT